MKNISILIFERFFFGLASLREVRQSISHSISLSLMIIDLKVVLRKLLGPKDLAKVQAFCIYESTKVIMVSKDKDLVFATFQVVAPNLKGFNNSQKFWILGLV